MLDVSMFIFLMQEYSSDKKSICGVTVFQIL